MSLPRRVEPEWLDQLPADDPRAMRSRRDLRLVNGWMLQAPIMARALIRHGGSMPPRTIVDLGAGDGTFMLRVARRLIPGWRDVTVVLVDRQDIVGPETRAAFATLGWKVETVAADVFDFLDRSPGADAITANLFLHHFPQERLYALLALIARRTRLFVVCEPRRAAPALLGSRLLWTLGCNDVSRHDAVVSVRAGFTGGELTALWPDEEGWELRERAAPPFAHCFVARRAGATP